LAVFLSGWVLGPIGGLLSVPITMMFKTVDSDSRDDTRWLSSMMNSEPNLADKTAPDFKIVVISPANSNMHSILKITQ
jgi:hypothetical protein